MSFSVCSVALHSLANSYFYYTRVAYDSMYYCFYGDGAKFVYVGVLAILKGMKLSDFVAVRRTTPAVVRDAAICLL
uniref:Uncharacterized protein n=1 Tax=Arion vulgaris TaxID=1028688 RepID=A0A0B7B1H9_9EUPU